MINVVRVSPFLQLWNENELQMFLGIILLAVSLLLLTTCLILLVKILKSLMENQGGKEAILPEHLFSSLSVRFHLSKR